MRIPLLAVGVLVAVVTAGAAYLHGGRYASTDNAALQTGLVSVAANVGGPVVSVDVRENEAVKAGQILFHIDPAPYDIAVREAEAQLAEARAQGTGDQRPVVRRAQAQLDRARLNLGYTLVRAAQDGIVTKVNQLQPGDYVPAARPVFWLAGTRIWVEANFKENQIEHMQIGQPATFDIDAFPNLHLTGHLRSFSPGTGNSFAVLPPENATGNWVKVVQRLPVEFEIDNPPADLPLHAGLSVNVTVDTGFKRHLPGADFTAALR